MLHPGAGPKSADIARPAEFLIDSNGVVRWANLTENIAVRARPEQVLKAFDEMGGGAKVAADTAAQRLTALGRINNFSARAS